MRTILVLVLPLFLVGHVEAQEWSGFGSETACIVPTGCGNGFKLSVRTCPGGPCPDEPVQVSDCSVPCQPLASWDDWSGYSSCSQRCGSGTQTRVRLCIDGVPGQGNCVGPESETINCQLRPCPEIYTDCYEPTASHSYMGNLKIATNGQKCKKWNSGSSNFKPADYPLAELVGIRCRSPGSPMGVPFCQTTSQFTPTDCDVPVCNAGAVWGEYSWTSCSATCDGGVRTGIRECIGGDIGQGGCTGSAIATENCNDFPCPPPAQACFADGGPLVLP